MTRVPVLDEENSSKQHGHNRQVDCSLTWETLEIVDDDPDVGSVEGNQDGGMIQSLPRRSTVVARHRVKQGAGQHTSLKTKQTSNSTIRIRLQLQLQLD